MDYISSNIDKIAENLSKKVNDIMVKRVLGKVEMIKQRVIDAVRDAVESNVYAAREPLMYERTRQLIDSISIGDIKICKGIICFEIYFDPAKMHYTTFSGGTTYRGGALGYWVPYWVDQGHWQPGGEYPSTDFLADAIKRIKWDLKIEFGTSVVVEVTPIGRGRY